MTNKVFVFKERGFGLWPLDQKRDREFPVTGMPNNQGEGFIDYVLWGDDSKPPGLVEAKRTKRSPKQGEQQAKLYADCLSPLHQLFLSLLVCLDSLLQRLGLLLEVRRLLHSLVAILSFQLPAWQVPSVVGFGSQVRGLSRGGMGASPDRVLIQWPNQSIMNRWLRITVLANEETGLAQPETYYIGHLLGETTGPSDGVFTVSFADITPIRAEVGQTVDASSITDIDKNGTVSFADISAMRGSVGAQLKQISVP